MPLDPSHEFVCHSMRRDGIATEINDTACDVNQALHLAGIALIRVSLDDPRLTRAFCTWYAKEYGRIWWHGDIADTIDSQMTDLNLKALRKLGYGSRVRAYRRPAARSLASPNHYAVEMSDDDNAYA